MKKNQMQILGGKFNIQTKCTMEALHHKCGEAAKSISELEDKSFETSNSDKRRRRIKSSA